MHITIHVERTGEKKDVDVASIADVFKKLPIDKNTVLVTRNHELLTDDDELHEHDELLLLSVISGG